MMLKRVKQHQMKSKHNEKRNEILKAFDRMSMYITPI
jgi:hypothetical protein